MNKYSDSVLSTLRESEQLSRTERFYQKIRQMILSGAIPAGYTFPNENMRCQELNIGRGTLREVYQSLLADGLISRSKVGTTVNTPDEILRNCPFSVATSFASFQDIFEFRRMLESEIVCAVATRATEEELTQLSEKIQEIYDDELIANNGFFAELVARQQLDDKNS